MEPISPSIVQSEVSLKLVENNTWPMVMPLPKRQILPADKFYSDWLPSGIKQWMVDFAGRSGCPMDYLAISGMVTLASIIGRKYAIWPKKYDEGWLVVPNLWGAIVGRPSAMKTPAIEGMLGFLKKIEEHEEDLFLEAMKEYEVLNLMHKAEEDALKEQLKKASRNNIQSDLATLKTQLLALKEKLPIKPTRNRTEVNDPTVESLGELLNENPNGLLLKRDELIGWFKNLERADRTNDKSFYLECFNGSGSYKYDRIGRGYINIKSITLSIIGCLTPGTLKPYISNAVRQGAQDDGLIQRFQLLVYPVDDGKPWKNVDKASNHSAEQELLNILKKLHSLPIGEMKKVHFSEEAQLIFDEWRTELENKLRNPDMHPATESHLGKYRSLMPSLALIIDLAEHGGIIESVSEESTVKAVNWCRYLESHALRIYSMGSNAALDGAHLLVNRMDKLPSPFKIRDISNKNWVGLQDKQSIEPAIDILLDHEYIREEIIKTRGRDSKVYHWNPNII